MQDGQFSQFAIDMTENPNWNGEMHYEWGSAAKILSVSSAEGFWACDSVLAAKYLWMKTNTSYGQQDLAAVYYAEYVELFNQTCTTYESTVAWLRSCHTKSLRLAADTLAQAVLDVQAVFIDGVTELRSYRIEPVANLEEVANGRFDALFERYGLGEEIFDPGIAPFTAFEGYVPTEDESDERLVRPLFTITDITA